MNIPDDLRLYLSKPENLGLKLPFGGEIQVLTFFQASELKLGTFTVDSWELFHNGDGLLDEDPGEQREYEGYSLVKTCNDYDPNGILAWFPCFNAFGTADTDHGRIRIFPEVTWSQLIENPMWYVNAQWYPDNVPHREINPWKTES